MESQKIINLLDHKDEDDPNSKQRNDILLMIRLMVNTIKEIQTTLQ